MTRVDKIMTEARELTSDQLMRLRKKLDDMEKARWETALARTSKETKRKSIDRKSTRLNSSHIQKSRMPSSA